MTARTPRERHEARICGQALGALKFRATPTRAAPDGKNHGGVEFVVHNVVNVVAGSRTEDAPYTRNATRGIESTGPLIIAKAGDNESDLLGK